MRASSTGFGVSEDTLAIRGGRPRARCRGRGRRRPGPRRRSRPARPARARPARSTAGTRARSCGSCPGSSPARREASSSSGTSRSRAGRSTGSPSRCGQWAQASRRPTGTRRSASPAASSSRIRWELPVASAQVKSCVLLAGLLAAGGATAVAEPAPTRDHTERLLRAAGARVRASSARGARLAGRAARAAPTRDSGRLLLGRAVRRGRDAARRARASGSTASA